MGEGSFAGRETSPSDNAALRPGWRRRELRKLPGLFRQAFSLVWEAARREVVILAGTALVAAIAVAAQLLVARSLLSAIVGPSARADGVGDVAPQLVVLALATAITYFSQSVAEERQRILGEQTARLAQRRLLDVAGAVDLALFENADFHDHLQRATVNAPVRPLQLVNGLTSIGSGLIASAGIGLAMLSLQPLVVPMVLAGFVPLWFAATRNSRGLYEATFALTTSDRERLYLYSLLVGKNEAKEVRAYQLEQFLAERADALYAERVERIRGVMKLRQRRGLFASAASASMVVATLLLLLSFTFSGRVEVAAAGAAALGVQQLVGRLRGVFGGVASLYECSLFLDDLASFFDLPNATPAGAATASTAAAPARSAPPIERIGLDGVSFTYPGTDRRVLDDVSLELARGEVLALVGENGSGKTTIVKLLAGLYAPTSGRVTWNGDDLASFDRSSARAQIAVVFQDYLEYQLSAAANIGVGRHERAGDRDDIVAAARESGADRFLASLPHGYDTLLSRAFQGGTELSVGQWQRVALARALFRDAGLVILDEPAAALDPSAEHALFDQVRQLCQSRAVLLISHRFSTVRSADRIVVIHDGRIEETGDHDALMRAGRRYADLFELQASPYRE